MKKTVLFFGLIGACLYTTAQEIYLSRFLPGKESHQIDIFNPRSDQFVDLSGHMLITREYILRFADNTFIQPMDAFKIGFNQGGAGLDMLAEQGKGFMQRELSGTETGNFALLYSPNMRVLDAFYFDQDESVSFLPARETFYTPGEKSMRVNIPEERSGKWSFIGLKFDPAMAFVRINDNWRITSRSRNLLPAVQYRQIQAKYFKGVITLKWTTLEELDCYQHIVERSVDGKNFTELVVKEGAGNSNSSQNYKLYDDQGIEQNRLYYYRIKNIDKFGNLVLSDETKVRTEENPTGFSLEISRDELASGAGLNIRFSAIEPQHVRVGILDEALREIAMLYYGDIEAERQNLLQYTAPLPVGKYYVIMNTEQQRYYEPFIIE